MDVEWTETYKTGDSGVVVSGHDWVGGWKGKRRKRREIRSVGEGDVFYKPEDARDDSEPERLPLHSALDWGPQTIY